MDLKIAGRRALVTGSTFGNGFATAVGLARQGAHVVANGLTRTAAADAPVRLNSTPLNHAQTVPGRGRVPQQAVEIAPEIAWAFRPPRATSGE